MMNRGKIQHLVRFGQHVISRLARPFIFLDALPQSIETTPTEKHHLGIRSACIDSSIQIILTNLADL
ncbi:hypothetical protein X739_28760 [Mesorhizobium sp. LNHC220B00]|nr:hypothetical protein X739_28760 [Mesorhizobium sp. LNHC220B00]